MRAENRAAALRHLLQLLDEDRAGIPQFVHDVFVVHDFLTHVNRRTIKVQCDFHHIDSPYDAARRILGA